MLSASIEPWASPLFHRNFGRDQIVIERAAGSELFDTEGRRFLLGGGSVVTIGYGIREVIAAIAAQAEKVPYAYWTHFVTEPQLALAEKILGLAPQGMKKVYFTSGGSEAMEVAVKLTSAYHTARGNPGRTKIIGSWHGYHGSTMFDLSIGGYKAARADYAPYLWNFPKIVPVYCYRCPLGKTYPACGLACADDLERLIQLEGADTVAAYVAEPLVAAGGAAIVPPAGYFQRMREICDRYGILFIADEIITGFGRTGHNFGLDHWEVSPDIIVGGKGLSGGYAALGTTIVHEKLVETFRTADKKGFYLGYSYSGNPLSCAATLAVQKYATDHRLYERVRDNSSYLRERLSTLLELDSVGDVRGLGFMFGIELVENKSNRNPFDRSKRVSERVFEKCLDLGLFVGITSGGINGVAGDYVMVHPPYILTREQMDEVAETLHRAISRVADDARCASAR